MKAKSVMAVGLTAVSVSLLVSGCVVVAAGAGAGGGIYFTSRGVESIVAAPVGRTFSATERAFRHFNVKRTSLTVEDEGKRRKVKGEAKDGDVEVVVTLKGESNQSTRVEVTARETAVTWDKDFARAVLEKIVELSS